MDYLRAVGRGLPLVLLAAAIGALSAYLIFEKLIPPSFTAMTSILISTEAEGDDAAAGQVVIGVSEEAAAREALMPEFIKESADVIRSREASEAVIGRLQLKVDGTPMKASSLQRLISTEADESAGIITIRVKDTDAQRAADIANVLRETAAGMIESSASGFHVTQLEQAEAPLDPAEDNQMLRLLIGALIGAAAALLILTLIFLGDDVIRTSRDAERMLGAEVIAVIPYSKSESTAFEEKKKKRGRRKTS